MLSVLFLSSTTAISSGGDDPLTGCVTPSPESLVLTIQSSPVPALVLCLVATTLTLTMTARSSTSVSMAEDRMSFQWTVLVSATGEEFYTFTRQSVSALMAVPTLVWMDLSYSLSPDHNQDKP